MMNLPLGMILLLVVSVLVFFGVTHRILDRMRLTDKQALVFIAAIMIGSYIDIPLPGVQASVNVGGALLPALLCVWLIYKADETGEKFRAVGSALLVAAAVSLGSRYLPSEPGAMFLDPKLVYGIVAGSVAYLAGRSRRSAFIGGVLGIIASDIVHMVTIARQGIAATTSIGGAGAFDVVIIAGVIGVMLAELVGETREKLQGGPILGNNRPEGLYEFSKDLNSRLKKSAPRINNSSDQETSDRQSTQNRGEKKDE